MKRLFVFSLLLIFSKICADDSYLHINYSPKTPATATSVRSSTMKRLCLNGKWDFLPIKGDKNFPNTFEFFNKITNEKITPPPVDTKWETILVPSMWAYYWGKAFLDKNGEPYGKKWGHDIKRVWYKRNFSIPAEWDKSRRIKLKFDGAAGFTKIFVNGVEAGAHYGSLLPFEFDITDKIHVDKENELLVYSVKRFRARRGEVSVELPDGRQNQYGIYRNVWLKNEYDIKPENMQIITSVRKKTIDIAFELINQTGQQHALKLVLDIVDTDGKIVKELGSKPLIFQKIETKTEKFSSSWENPKLWDVGQPNLYFARIRLYKEDDLVCEYQQRFGFREIWIDGPFFFLNGKKFTFRGDWIHSFWTGCPAQMYPDYMKIKIENFKKINIQGPRFSTADSPTWLLDLLDEAGFPIIATGITPNYYGDPVPECMERVLDQTKRWIRRDRNHPSILLWSTMNEATAQSKFHPRFKWQKTLVDAIADEDPTRPQYNDGHATSTGAKEFFTTGNLAGELTVSCGHYGNIYACVNDYVGFLNAPKYWPRKRPFIDGEEGVFGILPLYYPHLAVRSTGIKGLFYDIEKRRQLSGRWLKLICHAWRAWEIPGFMGFDTSRASWENPFPVVKKDYDRQYHKIVYLDYETINTPGPKGQLVIGHHHDDEPRANPWTKDYPVRKATSYAKYTKAAYAPLFASISRNWQANYFSGSTIRKKIDIVNDLREAATGLTLTWTLSDKEKKIAGNTWSLSIDQGKVIQKELTVTVPEVMSFKTLDLNVVLIDKEANELSSETLTLNIYPNVDYSLLKTKKIMIFDPVGETANKLSTLGINLLTFNQNMLNPHDIDLLLIGKESFVKFSAIQKELVEKYIIEGGNVFVFRQKTKKKVSACLVDKSAPQNPVFKGLKPGIISNWKIKPDSEIFKFPLNWPGSGRFNMLALIGASSAGRHELAMIENYIGNGRMVACNLELTDSVPEEPEAMILLRNCLNEYSIPFRYPFKKTVLISDPDDNYFMKEPFFIDAEHVLNNFTNLNLSGINTIIIGKTETLDENAKQILKEKLDSYRGNLLVLPQKDYGFINSLLDSTDKVKLKKLETIRGFRDHVQGIVGFLNKTAGELPEAGNINVADKLSQGLESFFQLCKHRNIGMPKNIVSALFDNPRNWTPILHPYDRLPGKSCGEFGVVPILDQLLMSKRIKEKNVILSRLELANTDPAIKRIYLTLLTNLGVGSQTSENNSFSLEKENDDNWLVKCGGFQYHVNGSAQLGAVSSISQDQLSVGKQKNAGILLTRTGFFGVEAPVWRFIPGMKSHPGDIGKPLIKGCKDAEKITISRKGIMQDKITKVKMAYETTMDFHKNGDVDMSYKFDVLDGSGKYKTALSTIRLDKEGQWTGQKVIVKNTDNKETVYQWPVAGERCQKVINNPKKLSFTSASGINWNLEVSSSLKHLTLRRGFHKGFELQFKPNGKNNSLELKKGDSFTFKISLKPQNPNSQQDKHIFSSIKSESILPMSNFEHDAEKSNGYFFIDIVKKCNAVLNGSKWSEKKSSVFKLPDLAGGNFWLNGTPFHIINADTDECQGGDPGQAMSMIIMNGEYRPDFPKEIKHIQVGKQAKTLCFLQSSVYMSSPSGKWDKKANLEMWKYRVNYDDGSHVDVPVIHHINVKDWYKQKDDLPGAKIAYVEKKHRAYFGVWSQEWQNPNPDKTISSINIESQGRGIPIIIAITGKKN